MRLPLLVCFLISLYSGQAQSLLSWEQLTDVTFSKKFDSELGIDIMEADFGASVEALNGKEIIIKGFMIPLDPLGTQYVISRNPMASCFFCGGAGPETVAELRLHPNSFRRYKTDENLSFRGKLMLNTSNKESLHYVILEAEKI